MRLSCFSINNKELTFIVELHYLTNRNCEKSMLQLCDQPNRGRRIFWRRVPAYSIVTSFVKVSVARINFAHECSCTCLFQNRKCHITPITQAPVKHKFCSNKMLVIINIIIIVYIRTAGNNVDDIVSRSVLRGRQSETFMHFERGIIC